MEKKLTNQEKTGGHMATGKLPGNPGAVLTSGVGEKESRRAGDTLKSRAPVGGWGRWAGNQEGDRTEKGRRAPRPLVVKGDRGRE